METHVVENVESGAVPPHALGEGCRETDFGPAKRWSAAAGYVVQRLGTADEIVSHGLVVRPRTVVAGGMVVELGAVNSLECVLDLMHDKGMLGTIETEAGELRAAIRRAAGIRLRGLHDDAGIAPRVCATYSKSSGGGRGSAKDAEAEAAEIAYRAVLRKPELRPYMTVLTSVCCHNTPPQAQRVATLVAGLDLLARHFGLTSDRRVRIVGGPLPAA